MRYVKVGSGPTLGLLHTLRTQLDIFQEVIPRLQSSFTVYALDYPGHGWSDLPRVDYHPEQVYGWVERFLEKADIREATLAGMSIGGTIALELAARDNPRVSRVVSINPFDYESSYSADLKGSSALAHVIFSTTPVPFLGEAVMRMRNDVVERKLFESGVTNPEALSDSFFRELVNSGNRQGHARGFISLLRQAHHWQDARRSYANISMPVLLIYGDQDWAPEHERQWTMSLISGAQSAIVEEGGHFLTLDQSQKVAQLILNFASSNSGERTAQSP